MLHEGRDPSILFDFNSVVIVGASDQIGRIGGAPIHLLKKYGFTGQIYGINPKYDQVQGVPCFADVESLPDNVDVAIFSVSAKAVQEMLPQLARKGLKGAVIFSAGFGETAGGKDLQDWLTAFARQNGIAVLGPNCVGQMSFNRKRPLSFSNSASLNPVHEGGNVALLSQSGGVATYIWADAVTAGTKFSHMITTGNEADLGLADYMRYFARDPETDVVLGYVEGLRDGLPFAAAAAELQRAGKALIMIRVGVSEAGQDAVSSHTGQLSSDDAGYQATFDRYGAFRVRTLQDLNDYARVFSMGPLKPKITAVTTSGGAGVYLADTCADLGVEMSKLSPETEAKLSEFVPSFGRVRNPVDLTAQVVNDMSILMRSMKILVDDPETGILLFLLSGKGGKEESDQVIKLFLELQGSTDKKLVVCWMGVPDAIRMKGAEAGLTIYQDPARFLKPLADYFRFQAARDRKLPPPEAVEPPPAPVAVGRHLVKDADGRMMLPERASTDLLEEVGVDVPKRRFARSDAEIAEAAQAIPFPVVMKITEPVLAHKSDVGGVVVGIKSAAELQAAWADMKSRLKATEVMVVEQIEAGTEVLVGALRDGSFGLRLTIGSGGVWTNFARDVVTIVPPFTEAEVRRLLPRLGVWAPLSGARGQKPQAVDALVKTILGIARFAQATSGELREFECNPVIVTSTRAVVVDALGFA